MMELRGSEVWLKSDVDSILTALLISVSLTRRGGGDVAVDDFYRGYAAAIVSMAKALGINSIDVNAIRKIMD